MQTYTNPLFLPDRNDLSINVNAGDPFVLRFDGKYYLYPSPPHGSEGVEAWTSDDLIHWTHAGLVATGEEVRGAYAPEVAYINGVFWMITSPRGEGHILLQAEHPLGPFRVMRHNFGHYIDGSLFQDDDGSLYMTHAEYPCIHAHRLCEDGELGEEVVLEGATMGYWTEGPMIVKRNGLYYLTMTGNHLYSRAYRVDYAVSREGPLGPYVRPLRHTLLVNTCPSHSGLGHSSTVIGPDLESDWICYHHYQLDAAERHRERHANLDRVMYNGESMVVIGPTSCTAPSPERPAFERRAEGETTFATPPMPAYATAEITLVPGAQTSIAFGGVFSLHFMQDGLILKDGGRDWLRTLWPAGFRMDVKRTVRLELRGTLRGVWVDGMLRFEAQTCPAYEAPIRIEGAKDIGYVAFHPFREIGAVLPVPGDWDAVFCKHDEQPREEGGFQPRTELSPGEDGAYCLTLHTGASATYRLFAASEERMRIQAVFARPFQGVIDVRLGGCLIHKELRLEHPTRVELGAAMFPEGETECVITCREGRAELSRVSFFPVTDSRSETLQGLELCHSVRQIEGNGLLVGEGGFINRFEGLQMDRPIQALAILGDLYTTDGSINARFFFHDGTMAPSAGVFFRLCEDSFYPDQVRVGHRGYYFGLDGIMAKLSRMDFDMEPIAEAPLIAVPNCVYEVRAEIRGGSIRCFVDGKLLLEAYDACPWPYGRLGVGSFGARITCTSVQYTVEG
ncbi:MAG: glycoside hydrolase family 43 protein [Eubacteriales bacterium]|nr:glycoside hydrolase family 43 protein [Eubacteriales bacterium]